jgi:hypothetical protein
MPKRSKQPLTDIPRFRPEYDAACAAKVGITVEEWQANNAKDQAALLEWAAQPAVRKAIDRASAREARLPISCWVTLPLGEARDEVLRYARQREAIKFRKAHPGEKRPSTRPRKARAKLDPEEAAARQKESKRLSARRSRAADPAPFRAADNKYKSSHHNQIIKAQRTRRGSKSS